MPLTLKELASRLEMPERTVTNRATRGQIPGAVKTGTGTRTRWSFPEEAASLKGTLAPPRKARNTTETPCSHCGAIFTTSATYVAHRKTVTINRRPLTACMSEKEMELCGLTRDSKGRWRRAQQRTLPLPGQPRQTKEPPQAAPHPSGRHSRPMEAPTGAPFEQQPTHIQLKR